MTTELEEQFFKTFGIEKNNNNCPMLDKNNCVFVPSECNYYQYPEITDRRLLKMICIVMKYKNTYRFINGIEDLKEQTLKILITLKDMLSIYAEIQQLFKEGE